MFVYSIDSVNRCNDTSQNDDWTCVTKCIFNEEAKRFGNIFASVTGTDPEKIRGRRIKRERIQNTDTIVCYHLVVVKQITRERELYIFYIT